MTKVVKEFLLDNATGEVSVEYDDNSTSSYNLGSVGSPAVETAATFAEISSSMSPRTVIVTADETNGGERTVYFHDGSALTWLPTVGLD